VTISIPGQVDLVQEVIATHPAGGRILDLGTGSGIAARHFDQAGWDVTATGYNMEAYLQDEPLPESIRVLPDVDICDAHQFRDGEFDAIWCAHVLEHVSNTGLALAEIRRILKPDGWLFIAVPPYKDQVVGGHVNTGWNVGMLMYVLADAGFGLAEGRFIHHGYNIFGMVRRGPGPLPAGSLRRANGDIEILSDAGRFPKGFPAAQGFEGRRRAVNWLWNQVPQQIPVARKELANPPPVAPMKIGLFLPWITIGRGNAENVGQMMANAMAARGHEVTVFTFDDKQAPSRWPLDERITLVHLPEADDESADDRIAIEIAGHDLDLLVGLQMNRFVLRYLRCAHRLGLPLVVSEHGDPRCRDGIARPLTGDRAVAMGGATLIHLSHPESIRILPPALQRKARLIASALHEPDPLAAAADREGEDRILLAVARLVPVQNQLRLVEAFAGLAQDFPQWRLQIVGTGPVKSHLVARIWELNLAERIDLVDENEDIAALYAGADLFVSPSASEGFGMELCEAMAHGLPVVGIRASAGARARIVGGKTGELCKAADPHTIAATLRSLMSDDKTRHRMGAAARQHYLSDLRNDVIYAAWEELFSEAKDIY
ncbi:glycosyltransferase, partial [Paracoccus seriniphilus]|uniref:glycosyltransferase n=1 Tax=Paracoccus seriniphilus TaxID=184748 RepID=UPI00356348DD